MPKLVHEETGEVIRDDLTVGELEELEENEVDFDVPEADLEDMPETPPEMEADEDETPDEIVETEIPESPDEVVVRPGDSDGEEVGADVVGGEAEHHLGEEMEDRDEDRLEEEYDIKLDEIEKVDDRDRARWANLCKQLAEYGDDVKSRQRQRDEDIENNSWRDGRDHASLRNRAKRNGIISDLEEGFRQMVSRPTPEPAMQGPQLDPHNVARRAAGDVTVRELFEEHVEVETGDRCIGLATDISGSMGSSIDELKIAGGAIAEATDIIGDEFVWEAFDDRAPDGLNLQIVCGPDEEWDWEYVDSFGSGGAEPTGAGIRDCRMLMEQTDAHEYIMIVVTDGMATVGEDGNYHGSASNVPVEHARQAVRETRESGIDVIGFGIGSMDDGKMRETFGEGNYRLTNIHDLAGDILGLYAEHMDVGRGGL